MEVGYADVESRAERFQSGGLALIESGTGRGTHELVQEAVAQLLAHYEWFHARVQIGIDQIARGEFLEEEMGAR